MTTTGFADGCVFNDSGAAGKGNQLTLSSKLQNTVVNLWGDSSTVSITSGGSWTFSAYVKTEGSDGTIAIKALRRERENWSAE